ncbi:TRAP transporter small permease [Rossellomorea marisflavi]|uniref:TRAP transporter small permease n=1 Tax=Rossellomorea marisflavi TaxID=189381 RepID=UPI0034593310
MNTYIKMINQINTAIKYIVSTMLIFLTILVVLQVTTRFVINVPLAWTEEIAKYLMIYIVFFGSGLAMRNNQHIAIDFMVEILKEKSKVVLEKIILWVCGIFSVFLIYFGSQLTFRVIEQSTPTLQYSMAWAYAAIPLGALLMLLNIIAALIDPQEENPIDEMVGDSQ